MDGGRQETIFYLKIGKNESAYNFILSFPLIFSAYVSHLAASSSLHFSSLSFFFFPSFFFSTLLYSYLIMSYLISYLICFTYSCLLFSPYLISSYIPYSLPVFAVSVTISQTVWMSEHQHWSIHSEQQISRYVRTRTINPNIRRVETWCEDEYYEYQYKKKNVNISEDMTMNMKLD